MRRVEKTWLAIGVVVGFLTAAAIYGVHEYRAAQSPSTSSPKEVKPDGAREAPVADTAVPTALQLTDAEQKQVGLETAVVTKQTIRKVITASGTVAQPETGVGAISARIGGRIDRLMVNVTGERVARGQAVALIYSPEIFSLGEEYKLALDNQQRLKASKESQAVVQADDLVRASRRRLELRGLTPEQIEEISSATERPVQITAYSPLSGIVTKRNVAEGQYIKEGDVLLEVADLSTAWIQGDIFEADLPFIKIGQTARITGPAITGSGLQGVISFLQPAVDAQTRTVVARLQVANPQMRLRPGMFVQIELQIPLAADAVAVPRSAVLETGQEKVVYVAKENGVFEKRPIEAETSGEEYYVVTRGLEPGERVVTHGNFLIDSQTRLTGAITGLFGGSRSFGAEASTGQSASAGYSVRVQSDPTPPKGGSEGTFHIRVNDPAGKPVTDAQVQLTLLMPAMPSMGMGEMRSTLNLTWNGSEYVGKGAVAMAGPWNVTVEARRNGQLLVVHRTRFDAK